MLVTASRTRQRRPAVAIAPVSVSISHAMAVVPTAWGSCGLVWKNREGPAADSFVQHSSALLCRIFTPGQSLPELRRSMQRAVPGCSEVIGDRRGNFHPEVVPSWFNDMVAYLQSYYAADLCDWTRGQFTDNWSFWHPRLDWSQVTPFQKKVLEVVAAIPSGKKMTYGQVAACIGKPAASRAVGAAIGSNPWPVLVPCHRVIGSTGKLTGFSAPGGIEAKRRMLEMENGELWRLGSGGK